MASAIWKYFTKSVDVSKAKCNACDQLVSRGGTTGKTATTSNMISHLKTRHTEEYSKYFAETQEKSLKSVSEQQATSDAANSSRQMTLVETIERKKRFDVDHPRAKEITKLIMEMIAIDYQPFSVVENQGFQKLISNLEPRYVMPSRRYFRDTAHPKLFKTIEQGVRSQLEDGSILCFTTDLWTSKANNDAFINLTAHFINANFIQNHFVLAVKHAPGHHTSASIGELLNSIFSHWNIEHDRIHAIVTDNGFNMVRAVKDSSLNHIPCMAHSLQLVINDGILAQRSVCDILAMGRKLVGHFKHSQLACNRLKEIQLGLGVAQHVLTQDVCTRWNSSFFMLERLLEQREALSAYCAENKLSCFNPHQWSLTEKIVNLLQSFEELTRQVSQKDVTVSMIIPAVYALAKFLSGNASNFSGIQTMKNELLQKLSERFVLLESNKTCVIATILDPRYKNKVFRSQENAVTGKQWLTDLVKEKKDNSDLRVCQPPPAKAQKLTSLWSFLDDVAIDSNSPNSGVDETKEITKYFEEALIANTCNIFEWWRNNKGRFPVLASIARVYLSAPASSVESERLFSTAGKVLTQLRNRLKPNIVEELSFLKGNAVL